jgi:hypothetical protein
MEPISIGILTGLISNALFKVICDHSTLSVSNIKAKISENLTATNFNIPNIEDLDPAIEELKNLNISEDDSPKKIEKMIVSNNSLMNTLSFFVKKTNELSATSSVNKTVNIQNTGSGNISFGDINQ